MDKKDFVSAVLYCSTRPEQGEFYFPRESLEILGIFSDVLVHSIGGKKGPLYTSGEVGGAHFSSLVWEHWQWYRTRTKRRTAFPEVIDDLLRVEKYTNGTLYSGIIFLAL
ncbi:hypothetical protein HZA98_04235 [Candidatus Woesearchaeota archaeon]|nr:hypothetical protein [Candidatus Woesearchaeota archaeon]